MPLNGTCTEQSAQRHILQALSRWPKDPVRPELQFQDVLRKRFEQAPTASTPSQSPSPSPSPAEEQELLRQANALYSLLDNRYQKKVHFGVLCPFLPNQVLPPPEWGATRRGG